MGKNKGARQMIGIVEQGRVMHQKKRNRQRRRQQNEESSPKRVAIPLVQGVHFPNEDVLRAQYQLQVAEKQSAARRAAGCL
jgi:hypothetical protein